MLKPLGLEIEHFKIFLLDRKCFFPRPEMVPIHIGFLGVNVHFKGVCSQIIENEYESDFFL